MVNNKELKKSILKPLDVIIFALLAVLTVLLFVAPSAKQTDRLEAVIGGKKVLEYDFNSGNYTIYDSAAVEVIEPSKFKLISGGGYNLLSVDRENREAIIYETDCGTTKECTKMRLSQGSIICVPHNLVIRFGGEISPPMVG